MVNVSVGCRSGVDNLVIGLRRAVSDWSATDCYELFSLEDRLLAYDGTSLIEDGVVVNDYDTSIGTCLDVYSSTTTIFVVSTSEVVPDGVYAETQLLCDLVHGAIG